MEEEEAVVEVDLCDGGARLAVGTHVGQFVVGSEGFAAGCCAHTACDVVFLAYDVVPDAVDGIDI